MLCIHLYRSLYNLYITSLYLRADVPKLFTMKGRWLKVNVALYIFKKI